MLGFKLPHIFKLTLRLTLILFLGLAFSIHDGLGSGNSSVDNTHESQLDSQSLFTGGLSIISENNCSVQVGPKNLFDGLVNSSLAALASDTMNEDERIHQVLPFLYSYQQKRNLNQQLLAPAFLFHKFADLSLIILSTVVFLH